jgi:hypothetical protein
MTSGTNRERHGWTPGWRLTPAQVSILTVLSLAAVAMVFGAGEAGAQNCQPGPFQECLQLELDCGNCGPECWDMADEAGPCYEALACQAGYYVHDRWHWNTGVNCVPQNQVRCYHWDSWSKMHVSQVIHETFERRTCYGGGPLHEVVITGTSGSGVAWIDAGTCFAYPWDDPPGDRRIDACE